MCLCQNNPLSSIPPCAHVISSALTRFQWPPYCTARGVNSACGHYGTYLDWSPMASVLDVIPSLYSFLSLSSLFNGQEWFYEIRKERIPLIVKNHLLLLKIRVKNHYKTHMDIKDRSAVFWARWMPSVTDRRWHTRSSAWRVSSLKRDLLFPIWWT